MIALLRDPCCGAYVPAQGSPMLAQAGKVEHFCSSECRDRFLRLHPAVSGSEGQ